MARSGSASRRETPLRRLGRAGTAALDLLLPPTCIACDRRVERNGLLCPECFRRTGFITPPFCDICGVPFDAPPSRRGRAVCPRCELAPPAFSRVRAALRYDEGARRLVLPLKHADRTELAAALAPMMVRAGAALLDEADLLVPVPLHRWRLFQRRYNQAALLARAVGRLAGKPVIPDMLVRERWTASLGRKGAGERQAEVEGAFMVRPSRAGVLIGRCLLLVDDVMTSGATAQGCAEVLLAAGAIRVEVLVAARVPDPRG
jgi:predicted amidophosphoribosyltransferase